MTILFDVAELHREKQAHQDWVFFLGDKEKNPQTIIGKWKNIRIQSPQELNEIIERTQKRKDVEAWNWGIRTGINNIACLDFDWEFLYYAWLRKFGDRAKTATYRTANKGYRVIFKTEETANDNPYKNSLHVEFENKGYAVIGGYAEDVDGIKQPYQKLCQVTLHPNTVFSFPNEIITDNTLIADTKKWLKYRLEIYDFLQYRCVNNLVNTKHIKLTHDQRLSILIFMLLKKLNEAEIHDFFRTIYDEKGRDYKRDITQAQIKSGKEYKEKGGKPHPCTSKKGGDGRVSVPLHQIFNFEAEKCKGCRRGHGRITTDKYILVGRRLFPNMIYVLDLLSEHSFICPTDSEEVFVYVEPIYVPAKPIVFKILEEEYGDTMTRQFANEVIAHLQRSNYIDRGKINQFRGSIPLLNGMLNIASQILVEHNHTNYLTFCYNARFERIAECPEWEKFLDQILPDKKDQQLLQEFMGYILLPAMPYHVIFWFHGVGRNGKGRVIFTIKFIIGSQNCSNLNLSEFNENRRFGLSRLYGKQMNVSSEPAVTKYGIQTNILKMASGEDEIEAELKGKNQRLNFISVAKTVVLGNRFPKTSDDTIAWWDRNKCIKFSKIFIGKDKVPNVEKRWLPKEANGILLWMLEGLYRLQKNGGVFTDSKSALETKTEFMKLSDPFNAWLLEKVTFDPNVYTIRGDAHNQYKDYCFEIGATDILTKNRFYAKLRDTPRVTDTEKKIKGKTERIWLGITTKTELDVETQKKLDKTGEKVALVAVVAPFHTYDTMGSSIISSKSLVPKPATSATFGEKINLTLKIIKDAKMIKREELLLKLKASHNISEKDADKLLYQLLREGVIFSPMTGCLKAV